MIFLYWKRLLLVTWLAMLSGCSALEVPTLAPANDSLALLELEPGLDKQAWLDLQRTQGFAPYLNDLLNDPVNQTLSPVTVNAMLVGGDSRHIQVKLPGGQQVTYQMRWFGGGGPDRAYWYGDRASDRQQRFGPGEVDIDLLSWAALARHGDKVFGEISVDGVIYRLDYVGAQQQVLVKTDPSKSLNDRTCVKVKDDNVSQPEAHSASPVAPSAVSVIRVLMMSTVEARAAWGRKALDYPGLELIMQDHLQFANRQLKSSGIDIQYEYAGYVENSVSEKTKSPADVLRVFRNPGTPEYDQMQAARERSRADLVLTAVADFTTFGAYYYADRKEAGISTWNALGDHLDMGHVLAHNIGAEHYWKEGDPDFFDPPYQHGYLLPGGRYRTIVADYQDCRTCERLSAYSNPRQQWNGQPLGTVERHDVVRRLNERAAEVAAFYP